MKRKISKFLGVGLALVMVLSFSLVMAAPVQAAATAVEDVWVQFAATPWNTEGSATDFTIHFTPTTPMSAWLDTITVWFPDGSTDMGPDNFDLTGALGTAAFYNVDADGEATTYSAVECAQAATLSRSGYRITVTTPVDLAAGTACSLLIEDGADVKCADDTSNLPYYIKMYTSQDTTPVPSDAFNIDITGPTWDSLTLSSAVAGDAAQYIFKLDTSGLSANLTANKDTVTFIFPYGTTIPSQEDIEADDVQWSSAGGTFEDGTAIPVINQKARMITVKTPIEIAKNANSRVKFTVSAGIVNPTRAATYNYYACTSDDELLNVGTKAITAGTAKKIIVADGALNAGITAQYSDNVTMINMYSSQIYVTVADINGNASTPASTVTVTPSTSGSGTFYTNAATAGTGAMTLAPTISVTTDDPDTTAQILYFKPTSTGTHTLHFTATNYDPVDWTFTVAPGVELSDSYGNPIRTFAPIAATPASETSAEYAGSATKHGGTYVQDAINAAVTGDTVTLGGTVDDPAIYEVDAGEFGIRVHNAITLTSLNGADCTTIDGSAATVDILYVTGANSTIDDLTIKGNKTTSLYYNGIDIRPSGVTIQNNKLVDIPYDMILVNSDHHVITSGTITNNILTGIGSGSSPDTKGIVVGSHKNAISGVKVTNNRVSNHAGYESKGIAVEVINGEIDSITVQGNTISNCYHGIGIYDHAEKYLTSSPTGMTDDYATTENTISDCTVGLWVSGVDSAPVFNFKNNTISGFTKYGVELNVTGSTGLTGADVNIQYNDITGTGDWGIYNCSALTLSEPVCKYNWFGDATGPGAGTGTYASTATGSGEAVSKDVTYEPWLHKSKADVVTDDASYQACTVKLNKGWNTLSTPVVLISGASTIAELIPSGYDSGFYYDATATIPGWNAIVTADKVLKACDAVYVKMTAAKYVLLQFDAGLMGSPDKVLAAGWNLISLAYLTPAGMHADLAVASVAKTAAGLPGYSQIVSPSMNANQKDIHGTTGTTWAVSYGQASVTDNMSAGLGYWIYMQNGATLAGFELTPIVPDLD